jgi:hypothetical protein
MWNIEYLLQAPSSTDRLIIPASVEAMFDRSLGTYDGANGESIEVEPPVPGADYTHGCDWAKSHDWTVICTLRTDVWPARLVAFERCGRLPWPQMTAKFEARLKRYGGLAQHDQTGLGSVVHDNLRERAHGVVLSSKVRSDLLSNYVNLVEKGEIRAPMITYAYREHLYASVHDAYGSGHLPDTICAMALAAVDCGAKPLWQPIGA